MDSAFSGEIPVGIVGRLMSAKSKRNAFLKVVDDRQGRTGGLYVFWSDDREFRQEPVFDDWVEDWTALKRYFAAHQLVVDWSAE